MSGRLPPSARRLREARARGQVAHAPTLTAAAALAGGALALGMTAASSSARVVALAKQSWAGAATGGAATGAASASQIVPALAAMILPVAAGAFVGALAAGLAQTRFLFAWGAFGQRRDEPEPMAATSFAAAAGLALVALAAGRTLFASLARADSLTTAATATAMALGPWAARAVTVVALAGLGEWAWRSAQLREALSMSRGEAERERREDEGDPRLRAEQRRRQRALSRDPLVDDVAGAQLVVTAEGVAVALKLVDGAAHVATSAGSERLRAQRIADVARRLGIPVRADDDLAAALAHLPAGATVPPALQARAQAALRAVGR